LILEERVAFDRELSLISVRDGLGETRFYPLVENVHEDGILRTSRAPAANAPQAVAESYATKLLDELEYVGVLALELFDTNFNLWDGAAATFLQRSLNALNRGAADYADVSADGKMGPRTLMALASFLQTRGRAGETVLLRCVNALQCADYIRQAELNERKESFLFGWVAQRVVI
jgi:lysozyme family protein